MVQCWFHNVQLCHALVRKATGQKLLYMFVSRNKNFTPQTKQPPLDQVWTFSTRTDWESHPTFGRWKKIKFADYYFFLLKSVSVAAVLARFSRRDFFSQTKIFSSVLGFLVFAVFSIFDRYFFWKCSVCFHLFHSPWSFSPQPPHPHLKKQIWFSLGKSDDLVWRTISSAS